MNHDRKESAATTGTRMSKFATKRRHFFPNSPIFLTHGMESGLSIHALMENLRFAVRMLIKRPGFTAAAVVCLALGIGATTAIFSVVNAVVLRPLPYRDPGSLVRLYTEFPTFPNGGLRRFWTSGPEFLHLRRDTRAGALAWLHRAENSAEYRWSS